MFEENEKLYNYIETYRNDLKNGKLELSISHLSTMYLEKDLIINQNFLKLFTWTDYQKSRLIESILLGIPIPSIYVAENMKGQWELVDGLQRLCTLFSFMGKLENENIWKLSGCTVLKEINGMTFDELPMKVQNIIKRATCRVEIIYYEKDNVKFELFKRFNTCKTELSDEEVINAIYPKIEKIEWKN